MRRSRIAVFAAIVLATAACSLIPGAAADTPFPYPDGCAHFELSQRRCDFLVQEAMRRRSLEASQVQRIVLLGDPGCGAPPPCARTQSFVARVRLVTALGSPEELFFCGVGGQYTLVCGDQPQVQISSVVMGGYRDTPGDATPLPAIDPAAQAAARPFHLAELVVKLDHVGHYDIPLGTAVLPNGILTEATIESATVAPDTTYFGERGVRLDVQPEPGRPPFDNYYARGWHEGTETVAISLQFDLPEVIAGGMLTVKGIVVS
jgi:hypothetical protein